MALAARPCVQLKWLLENVPAVALAAAEDRAAFGTVDSWLLYQARPRA